MTKAKCSSSDALLAGAYKFAWSGAQEVRHSPLGTFNFTINYVSTLLCVGYGFEDLHINAVVRSWLECSPERALVIVGPDATSVRHPLLHLATQIELVAEATTTYLQRHTPQPLSPLEQALKAVREDRKSVV